MKRDGSEQAAERMKWNWRSWFKEEDLQWAQEFVDRGESLEITRKKQTVRATLMEVGQVRVELPAGYNEAEDSLDYRSYAQMHRRYPFGCTCEKGRIHTPCKHVAALLLTLEKEHGGPWSFVQTAKERRQRQREEQERLRAEQAYAQYQAERQAPERVQKSREELERIQQEQTQQTQGDGLRRAVLDWRRYADRSVPEQGQILADTGKVTEFEPSEDFFRFTASVRGTYQPRVALPKTYAEYLERLEEEDFYYRESIPFSFSCSCAKAKRGEICTHVAALLTAAEQKHGFFLYTETEKEKEERQERERREAEERRREEERREEERRREEEEEKLRNTHVAASRYLGKKEDDEALYFQIRHALSAYQTSLYDLREVKESNPDRFGWKKFEVKYGQDGQQELVVSAMADGCRVSMTFTRQELTQIKCSCSYSRLPYEEWTDYWHTKSKPHRGFLCAHALVVAKKVIERVQEERPGDSTDMTANRFLSRVAALSTVLSQEQEEVPVIPAGIRDVDLVPRIRTSPRGDLQLEFMIRRGTGRSYVVKSVAKLYEAAAQQQVLDLGKIRVDFSQESFSDEGQKWFDFLQRRVARDEEINTVLATAGRSTRLGLGDALPLRGQDLDELYDLMAGTVVSCAWNGSTHKVPVGPHPLRVRVSLLPERTGSGQLHTVQMSGQVPTLLSGKDYRYCLTPEYLSRVREEELEQIRPFSEVAGSDGSFSMRIGEKHFADLYYRVLPGLRDAGCITLDDQTGEIPEEILPPEALFTFYLDRDTDQGLLTCRAVVQTGEREPEPLMQPTLPQAQRDWQQEERVKEQVKDLFPQYSPESGLFSLPDNSENLYELLTAGVQTLSALGEVRGSEAFERVHVRPFQESAPQVSVEIEGGLLDLEVLTSDLSAEELLELLESYQKKKRWHRLRSGDFITLGSAGQLQSLQDLSEAFSVPMKELLQKGARIPRYRALYVERLLEQHDDLAAQRDRSFKSLVRSFRTIADSDYELPADLRRRLRPYQVYGFRWLCTLADAGFGGILADEMGLGKTLQTLALLQYRRRERQAAPSLIVCPASLVYNWREEVRKFTPGQSVTLLSGSRAEREAALAALAAGEGTDLYVTSYDTCRRDITLYEPLHFDTIVLDEAQFIKNQRAGVTRAVKVLKGDNHLALTGTPIENRLSELWSIFDFLMPGFLYTAAQFREEYELPIVREKNQAVSERLARMTEPFILRRKKEDVLRDLPEKLEEERRAQMQPDQRRLYDAEVVRTRELLAGGAQSGQDKIRVLAQITRLRQICCDPALVFENYKGSSAKREACLELIENAMDGGHRMLVFSQFTTMLGILERELQERKIPFLKITGETPKKERLELVNQFNEGDTPVFLISLRAGGTGLNLTGADVVIHYDPWWNVAVMNQATDRAHRIGQTRRVTVMKLIAAGTIEEKIMQLQEAKRDLADSIMSGKSDSLAALSNEEILALLQ